MSEFVKNKLMVKCNNTDIRNNIKNMLFTEDENQNQVFTMQRLLPLPKDLPDPGEYQLLGSDWRIAIWGTKYDALGCKISGNSDTISISYETADDPNMKWIEALCRYILVMSSLEVYNDNVKVSLTHSFYRLIDDAAGKLEWTPGNGFRYMEDERIF